MTLNADYDLSDGTWVRKALPENLRLKGEPDAEFAERMGLVFFPIEDGEDPILWAVSEKLHDVPPDPPEPRPRDLAAEIDALKLQIATQAAKETP